MADEITSNVYELYGMMDYETTYYWQIIAEDEYGGTTE